MPLEHRLHTRCGWASIGSVELAASSGRPFTLPSSTRHFERDRPFAVEHLALDIALDVRERRIRATATLDVRRVDPSATEIALDAVGLEIGDVPVDGKRAPHTYDARAPVVPLPAAPE